MRFLFTDAHRAVAKTRALAGKLAVTDAVIEANNVVHDERMRRYLLRRVGACEGCYISEWRSAKLALHLHHKDGDKKNTRRSNCELLCPNCHSITPNFGNKKRPSGGMADTVGSEPTA